MRSTLTVGAVTILSITDVDLPPRSKLAEGWPDVPAAAWEPYRGRFPHVFGDGETWHNHVGCFVVRSGSRLTLVDSGLGPGPFAQLGARRGSLLDELRACGITPADVDTVFMTHLHTDHVGWNLLPDGALTFSRARYVMSQAEWDARPAHAARAEAFGQAPYLDRTVTPLRASDTLDFVTGEHALAPDVLAIPTPGHSPGHMSVIISSGGEKAIILGDVLLHPAQVTEPDWSARMDMDGEAARVMRRQVLDRVESEGMTMAAGHIRGSSFGRIVRLEGRRYWQGVEMDQPAGN